MNEDKLTAKVGEDYITVYLCNHGAIIKAGNYHFKIHNYYYDPRDLAVTAFIRYVKEGKDDLVKALYYLSKMRERTAEKYLIDLRGLVRVKEEGELRKLIRKIERVGKIAEKNSKFQSDLWWKYGNWEGIKVIQGLKGKIIVVREKSWYHDCLYVLKGLKLYKIYRNDIALYINIIRAVNEGRPLPNIPKDRENIYAWRDFIETVKEYGDEEVLKYVEGVYTLVKATSDI